MAIKNYTTKVDIYTSVGEIQSALARAGASKIIVDYDGGKPQAVVFCLNDSEAPTEKNMVIATNQVSRWKNGDIRPVPATAVFITVSNEGVVLRDSWEETAQTGHWRA